MVAAIFPAAGASRRMGGGVNKNFMELLGEPILIRTLKTFSQIERVKFLIVVAAEHEFGTIERLLQETYAIKPWVVAIGGSERQYSIANALNFLPVDAETILIHDAARPLVSARIINEVIDAAERFGGAIAAVPSKDTVKVVDAEGFVRFTPPRKELVSVQTPQGFKREVLLRAYAQAGDFLGTDDASLVERLGVRIKVVAGSYDNIKITTPEDLSVAETLLRSEIK